MQLEVFISTFAAPCLERKIISIATIGHPT